MNSTKTFKEVSLRGITTLYSYESILYTTIYRNFFRVKRTFKIFVVFLQSNIVINYRVVFGK